MINYSDLNNYFNIIKDDFEVGKFLLKTKYFDPPKTRSACYLFNQATEKILKLYLDINEKTYKKNHNIKALFKSCTQINSQFKKIEKNIGIISPYTSEINYFEYNRKISILKTNNIYIETCIICKFLFQQICESLKKTNLSDSISTILKNYGYFFENLAQNNITIDIKSKKFSHLPQELEINTIVYIVNVEKSTIKKDHFLITLEEPTNENTYQKYQFTLNLIQREDFKSYEIGDAISIKFKIPLNEIFKNQTNKQNQTINITPEYIIEFNTINEKNNSGKRIGPIIDPDNINQDKITQAGNYRLFDSLHYAIIKGAINNAFENVNDFANLCFNKEPDIQFINFDHSLISYSDWHQIQTAWEYGAYKHLKTNNINHTNIPPKPTILRGEIFNINTQDNDKNETTFTHISQLNLFSETINQDRIHLNLTLTNAQQKTFKENNINNKDIIDLIVTGLTYESSLKLQDLNIIKAQISELLGFRKVEDKEKNPNTILFKDLENNMKSATIKKEKKDNEPCM